jgi:quercetin dioxygenase-like cupin family protein
MELIMSRTHQPDEGTFRAILSEDIEWKPFAAFPPSARLAVLVGDPSQAGPYVTRVHIAGGTKLMPHKHPEDRIYTVMYGVFYIGLGEEFDETRLTAYGVGSVIVLPGDQPHFHWAKSGDYITQVTAIGPLGMTYINPADDPRCQQRSSKVTAETAKSVPDSKTASVTG